MAMLHDVNFWLAVFVVLALIYVPGGLLLVLTGRATASGRR